MARGTIVFPVRGGRLRCLVVLALAVHITAALTPTGVAAAGAVGAWRPQRHVLVVPGDGWSARPRATTHGGVVLGVLFSPDDPAQPRVGVWTDGVLRDLGPGDPVDVDDRGDVVAVRAGSIVRWRAGQGDPLVLPLPAGTAQPVAVEIDDRGDVAGTVLGADGRSRVVLWPAAGGVDDLGPGACLDEGDPVRVARLTNDATIIAGCAAAVLIGRHGRLERLPREPSAAARREGRWVTGGVAAVSRDGRFIATGPHDDVLGELWERGHGVVHRFTWADTASAVMGDRFALSGEVLGVNEKGQVLLHYLGSPQDEDVVLTWDAEHGLGGDEWADAGALGEGGDRLVSSGLIGSVTWYHAAGSLALWQSMSEGPLVGDCRLVSSGRLACTESDAGEVRIVLWR